jgi:predicted chitinase
MDAPAPRGAMDAAAFFTVVREALFAGTLSQSQVDGINGLLAAWAKDGNGDKHQLAYVLATCFHESARTMQPIAEYGHGKGHPYGATDATGKAPYGRGLIQLTWRSNYLKADHELGLGGKLASNYDLALEPDIATKIAVRGMREGWFTGRKLDDYVTPAKPDYVSARKIINGTDRATLIAGYAVHFEIALTKAGA